MKEELCFRFKVYARCSPRFMLKFGFFNSSNEPMVIIKEINASELISDNGDSTLLQQIDRAKGARKKTNPAVDEIDDDELTPFGRAMFAALDLTQYLIPLVFVNAGLNILVAMQYGQDIVPTEVITQALSTIPVMAVIHLMFHPQRGTRLFRVISFFAFVFIGMHVIHISYEESYFAVMQRTPPLGTLFIWILLEMNWEWSATAIIVLGAFMYKKGYTF